MRAHALLVAFAWIAGGCGARTPLAGDGDPAASGGGGAAASASSGPGGLPDGSVAADGSATSAGGGARTYTCAPDEPVLQLAGVVWPIALAEDEANVYVASYDEAGSVVRASKDGAHVAVLAELSWPSGLAVANGWLYVASSGDRELVRVPLGGGDVEHLADFYGPSDVAVQGEWVYVANYLDNEVARVPLEGGSPEVLASGQNGVYKLGIFDGLLAWGSFDPIIGAVPLAGGATRTLAGRDGRRFAGTESFLYATSNHPDGGVVLRTNAGGDEQILSRDAEALFLEGITVDATHAYYARWTGPHAGSVARIPREGGPPQSVFEIDEPIDVLVGGNCLYVAAGATEAVASGVYRVGLPEGP